MSTLSTVYVYSFFWGQGTQYNISGTMVTNDLFHRRTFFQTRGTITASLSWLLEPVSFISHFTMSLHLISHLSRRWMPFGSVIITFVRSGLPGIWWQCPNRHSGKDADVVMLSMLVVLSREENAIGRLLKTGSEVDKTRAGKMMAAVAKAQNYSSQQLWDSVDFSWCTSVVWWDGVKDS